MEKESPNAIDAYRLNAFKMKVQGMNRTLVDKVFAVCDYYLDGKVEKHSRHLYDIYKLLPLVPQDIAFEKLIKEVRLVRAQTAICPSAAPEINVSELLTEIINKQIYKQDYEHLTMQLLEEPVSYHTAITALEQITASRIF